MASHNKLGIEGETISEQFLQKKGFKILNTNWRHLRYEVDIIALDKDFLVFIEVKTRSSMR
jgi:putative endonuclease